MIKGMDLVHSYGKMVKNIGENGRMVYNMGKV